jgi:hypothetical protein
MGMYIVFPSHRMPVHKQLVFKFQPHLPIRALFAHLLYNSGKRLYFLSKYLLSFYLVSMTLLKMVFISFTHTHYIPCLTPPWGQNLYPKDNEIHNFGRHIGQFWHFSPRPMGPMGIGNLKFTIYVPLVPKIHHIKFEKNWSSGYQDVKNVQMCTLYTSCLAQPWGQNLYPEDNEIRNFSRGLFSLHRHAISFS